MSSATGPATTWHLEPTGENIRGLPAMSLDGSISSQRFGRLAACGTRDPNDITKSDRGYCVIQRTWVSDDCRNSQPARRIGLDFPATSGIMLLHGGNPDAAPFPTNPDPQRTEGDSPRHGLQSPRPPHLLACSGDRATAGGNCRLGRRGCLHARGETPESPTNPPRDRQGWPHGRCFPA